MVRLTTGFGNAKLAWGDGTEIERNTNHETALMRPVGYSWDNAMIEGRRRLALLEHSLDPSTIRRLEAIGVAPGWRCLDVGAGGGTICEWLCRRVGPSGRVTAMDLDARFLRALDYANLDVREENVVDAAFPSGAFDLVHTRWTLLHIHERERVLQKFADCLAPGGTLFLEEPDSISVRTLDRTGFLTLSLRVFEIVQPRGSHPDWARDLPFKMASLGLGNVRVEGETPYFHGASELAEFWRISWGRVRDSVAESGADVTQWDRELAELDDPTRLFVSPMTIAVIATKT